MTSPRHSRQVRLVDVGAAGQRRLAEATVPVSGAGLGVEVEARYLAGAGIGTLAVADEALVLAAHAVDPDARVVLDATSPEPSTLGGAPFDARDPAARDIAEGAWRALRAMRKVLGVGADGAGGD